jgi:calcineurin-like phosphoesterase family protein
VLIIEYVGGSNHLSQFYTGKKMKIWFTSDTHFGHESVIGFSERPFKSITHMNEELIKRWNERVAPNDIVFFLGDFCFKSSSVKAIHFIERLNGNITFIQGNHDHNNGTKACIWDCSINLGSDHIYLIHDPSYAHSVIDYFNIVFHGHTHSKEPFSYYQGKLFVNVCVEAWDYYPVSYETIKKVLKKYEAKNGKRKYNR